MSLRILSQVTTQFDVHQPSWLLQKVLNAEGRLIVLASAELRVSCDFVARVSYGNVHFVPFLRKPCHQKDWIDRR